MDVLAHIDACRSGSVAKYSSMKPSKYTKEVITSCGYHEYAPAGFNTLTSTKAMISELKTRAAAGRPYTVVSLHRGVSNYVVRKCCHVQRLRYSEILDPIVPMPLYHFFGEDLRHRSIVIQRQPDHFKGPSRTRSYVQQHRKFSKRIVFFLAIILVAYVVWIR